MVNKWNRIKKDFLKELITIYLKGSKELKDKSIEIYCPIKSKRIYVDYYIPENVVKELNPFGGSFTRLFYSGPTFGNYFEINKDPFPDSAPIVVPLFEIDASSSFAVIDPWGCCDKEGYYWVRSMDTIDLIEELKNRKEHFLTSDLCTDPA